MFYDAIGWVFGAVMAVLLAVIGWVIWAAWQDSQRPTFELKRDDWACTKSEARTHLQPMLVGKVTTLVPMSTNVCLQYSRIAG